MTTRPASQRAHFLEQLAYASNQSSSFFESYTLKTGAPPQGQDYINIGSALSLDFSSARNSYLSQEVLKGYQFFIRWLTRQGGVQINGTRYQVKFTFIDDQADREQVEAITDFLVKERGIKNLLGPSEVTHTMRAAKVVQKSDAVMVSSLHAASAVFKDNPRVFSTVPPAEGILNQCIQIALQNATTVAYIEEDVGVMREVCSTVTPLSTQFGVAVVYNETLPEGSNMSVVNAAVARMKQKQPDVIIGCVHESMCHDLIRATSAQRFTAKAIVMAACVTFHDFMETLGAAGKYVLGPTLWHPSLEFRSELTSFNVRTFVEEMRADNPIVSEQRGAPPARQSVSPSSVSAFASAAALVRAIEIAGTTAPEKVAEVLGVMDNMSVFGRINFDDNGQSTNQMLAVQYDRHGDLVAVSEPPKLLGSFVTREHVPCFDSDPRVEGTLGIDGNGSCVTCRVGEVALFNASLGYRLCTPRTCPKGRYFLSSNVFVEKNNNSADKWKWWSQDARVYCALCPVGTFAARPSQTQCDACPPGAYSEQRGQTACQYCEPGKFSATYGSFSCNLCPVGKFADCHNSASCRRCPEAALCEPDEFGLLTGWVTAPGYYSLAELETKKAACHEYHDVGNRKEGIKVMEKEDVHIYKCIHGEDGQSCALGSCETEEETGELTAEGPFCGICRPGFGRGKFGKGCERCPSVAMSLFICMMATLRIAFFTVLFLVVVLVADLSKPKNLKAAILKQVLNYFGVCQVMFTVIDLRWPGTGDSPLPQSVRIIRDMIGVFGGDLPFGAHAYNCLAQRISENYWFLYFIFGAILVPFWIGTVVLFFHHVSWFRIIMGKRPVPRARLITVLLISMYVIHPMVSDALLTIYRCHWFDKPRLQIDTRIVCTSDGHLPWMILGVLSFCAYSFGIPFGFFLYLRSFYLQGELFDKRIMKTAGFLYSGFEHRYYYFESIFMLRKLLYQMAVFVPALICSDQLYAKEVSVMVMLCVAFGYLFVHMSCRPYDDRSYFVLDTIEVEAIWATVVTLLVEAWRIQSVNLPGLAPQMAMDVRDVICCCIVGFFHARFLSRALFRTFRTEILNYFGFDIYGHVQVVRAGLKADTLNPIARKSFASLFKHMAELFVVKYGEIRCEEFVATLSYACAESVYHQLKDKHVYEEEEIAAVSGAASFMTKTNWKKCLLSLIRWLERRVKRLPRAILDYLNRCGCCAKREPPSSASNGMDEEDLRRKRDLEREAELDKIRRLRYFNKNSIELCVGEKITLEELHISMMKISRSIEATQGREGQHPETDMEIDETDNSFRQMKAILMRHHSKKVDPAFHLAVPWMPTMPEPDILPEELPKLNTARYYETCLRLATGKMNEMQEKHAQVIRKLDQLMNHCQEHHANVTEAYRRVSAVQADGQIPCCPDCGIEVLDGAGFCWNCGCFLSDESRKAKMKSFSALETQNKELEAVLGEWQRALDLSSVNQKKQKSGLEERAREMEAIESETQRNHLQLEALRQESDAVAAQAEDFASKIQEVEHQLYAVMEKYESLRGALEPPAVPEAQVQEQLAYAPDDNFTAATAAQAVASAPNAAPFRFPFQYKRGLKAIPATSTISETSV